MTEPIPHDVQAVLPTDTTRTWTDIAEHLPEQMVLVDGTALAVHLKHRVSRDLDFFFTDPGVDLAALRDTLQQLPGGFAVTQESSGTLNGVYSATKIQFLDATSQTPIGEPSECAGLCISGLDDILATKLKVIGDRPALRDYYDLKLIEQRTRRTVEEGLRLYMRRYGVSADDTTVAHIIMALGYLDDVDPDDLVPESKKEIERYWAARQPQIARNATRWS